jgi:pimeloyl-ACP methyl ester carboxylesterase
MSLRNLFAAAAIAALLTHAPWAAAEIHRESFYVGGSYVESAGVSVMQGQMYVEALIPARVTQRYPLVLVHGGAQTAMNFTTTPDGRKGWAQWFAEQGWKVYMVDTPARGRSAWQPNIDGKLVVVPASRVERNFTAPGDFNEYPQAKLHTQWPGGERKGRQGDPIFDQFYASQVPFLPRTEGEQLTLKSSVALLDRIGPAVLLVHSQSGQFAWSIADARPASVKGIVSLEPGGPPFKDLNSSPTDVPRPWGLSSNKLTYEPAVTADSSLAFERQGAADAQGLSACWLYTGPPRRLSRIAGIPTLLVVAEASYHAQYDHCTSKFLGSMGVEHDFVRLGDKGIHGNGHMMMLEKNNLDIAAFLNGWMSQHIK